jgi:hypothetical protein
MTPLANGTLVLQVEADLPWGKIAPAKFTH